MSTPELVPIDFTSFGYSPNGNTMFNYQAQNHNQTLPQIYYQLHPQQSQASVYYPQAQAQAHQQYYQQLQLQQYQAQLQQFQQQQFQQQQLQTQQPQYMIVPLQQPSGALMYPPQQLQMQQPIAQIPAAPVALASSNVAPVAVVASAQPPKCNKCDLPMKDVHNTLFECSGCKQISYQSVFYSKQD